MGEEELEQYRESSYPRVEIFERRIAKIETQTETITVELRHLSEEQRRLGGIITQLSDVIAALGRQQITSEATLKAVIDRTELHAKEIESIQKEQVDVGKILENLKSRLQIVVSIGALVGGAVVTYVFSQIVK